MDANEFSILYEDLFDSERQDNYSLRENGKIVCSLGDLKNAVKSGATHNSLLETFRFTKERLNYYLSLYQLYSKVKENIKKEKNIIKIKSTVSEEDDVEDFIVNNRGLVVKKEKFVVSEKGYVQYYFLDDNNKRKIKFSHRKVMEDHLGRELDKDETVHHIDFDKTNNYLDNLYLCCREDHGNINKNIFDIFRYLFQEELIRFVDGIYILDEYFYDEIDRYKCQKKVFNDNLKYYGQPKGDID